MRPQIIPSLRRIPRGRRTIQLGVRPEYATSVEFSQPRGPELLRLLDGTRTEAELIEEAARFGTPAEETRQVLHQLYRSGLVIDGDALLPGNLPPETRHRLWYEACGLSLRMSRTGRTPAAVLQRRRRSAIVIRGRDRMVPMIASLLGAAGVGRMEIQTSGTVGYADLAVGGALPSDLGRSRKLAAADAVRRVAPETEIAPLRDTEPDLVVLVGPPPACPGATIRYALRRTAHLAVWQRDGVVVLGPLVRPGQTVCLDCLHYHRQDRDPMWPMIAAHLSCTQAQPDAAEAVVIAIGAALAAAHSLEHLDGGMPESVGRTLEISSMGEIRRRRWAPHPECGCLHRGFLAKIQRNASYQISRTPFTKRTEPSSRNQARHPDQ